VTHVGHDHEEHGHQQFSTPFANHSVINSLHTLPSTVTFHPQPTVQSTYETLQQQSTMYLNELSNHIPSTAPKSFTIKHPSDTISFFHTIPKKLQDISFLELLKAQQTPQKQWIYDFDTQFDMNAMEEFEFFAHQQYTMNPTIPLITTDNTTQLSTQGPSNAIQQFWSTSSPNGSRALSVT